MLWELAAALLTSQQKLAVWMGGRTGYARLQGECKRGGWNDTKLVHATNGVGVCVRGGTEECLRPREVKGSEQGF